LFAELFKAPLLWQKDETIPQTQNRKRCTVPQAKILAELLRNRKLAFLADLGRRQILEGRIVSCHR
jgi:hypothetical protein